jgi:two-component system phosphate regulon sensor histidine kinase PhoR
MNPRRIQLIIGLMALSLAGIICLQIYWIGWNIRLNEEQFDKNVYAALNRVASRLQYYETARALEAINAGKGRDGLPGYLTENGFSKLKDKLSGTDSLPDPRNEADGFKGNVTLWEYMKVSQLVDSKPLAERIPPDLLGNLIREELESRGIRSKPQYGVYSKSRRSYVIVNDHFVVEDSRPQLAQGGVPTLFSSPYKVALFTQDIESPGDLSLYFPNRTRIVIGSVLGMLSLSIMFTGIVLFCFWYTIKIIYRQKQLSEMKTDFINNMTHEFKTPIATISLAADNISSPMVINTPDKIKRFVDIIRQENRRMNSQVERVLQMALIDKKDFQLKLADLNLHELIEQAVSNFSLQVEKREGSLRMDLGATNPIIEGDATHIAGVIHNLLDNANKYSPEKPDITISTHDVHMGIEVVVTDKGMGISKEVRKHIFDKFYREHTGNVHNVKGFGLGLSYVKAIMTAHKGLVDVHSEPGKGSSFILTFPR